MVKKAPKPRTGFTVETTEYRYLFAVTDQLNLDLVELTETDKGFVYVYIYIDKVGPSGQPNTKFDTRLPLPQDQLVKEISKGIFKIRDAHK